MLFISRPDPEAIKAALKAARLYDSHGVEVSIPAFPDDVESAALCGLNAMVTSAYGRWDVVWPADVIAITGDISGTPLFQPPDLGKINNG